MLRRLLLTSFYKIRRRTGQSVLSAPGGYLVIPTMMGETLQRKWRHDRYVIVFRNFDLRDSVFGNGPEVWQVPEIGPQPENKTKRPHWNQSLTVEFCSLGKSGDQQCKTLCNCGGFADRAFVNASRMSSSYWLSMTRSLSSSRCPDPK